MFATMQKRMKNDKRNNGNKRKYFAENSMGCTHEDNVTT
jgi:hypothetical protein